MIAAALAFNSGILLVADAEANGSAAPGAPKIVHHRHSSAPRCAQAVFAVSDVDAWTVDAFECCRRGLAAIAADSCTIERMRAAIEQSLLEAHRVRRDARTSERELTALVALYSPFGQRYELFHTLSTVLHEVVGHDCVGPAAYLGHYLTRDRYNAARSM